MVKQRVETEIEGAIERVDKRLEGKVTWMVVHGRKVENEW